MYCMRCSSTLTTYLSILTTRPSSILPRVQQRVDSNTDPPNHDDAPLTPAALV